MRAAGPFEGDVLVSSPVPLLFPAVLEHPAGISRRLKTQEVLMKALIFRETGEPNGVLKMAEIPTPPLAPGEALVRVLLSPINPSDLHMVRGRYGYQPELPASPGAEGVGIVEAVGPGAQGSLVGTRMIFVTSGLSSIDTKNILSLQSASS
jgi:hypothetical protein